LRNRLAKGPRRKHAPVTTGVKFKVIRKTFPVTTGLNEYLEEGWRINREVSKKKKRKMR
jgi:hypothetical protein